VDEERAAPLPFVAKRDESLATRLIGSDRGVL
jgi:hypothetical protein